MAIHLGHALRRASCDQPGRLIRKPTGSGFPLLRRPYSVLLPVGFAVPSLLPRTRCALTAPFHPYLPFARRRWLGGLLSVALSLGSPPPEVIRHRASMEPGLSSPPIRKNMGEAAIQPADQGNKGLCAPSVKRRLSGALALS